ncbi:MAG: CtkA family protein, partial [Bacillota bacterium]|nr:CtkA family protein [Bacillota bacterium]
PLSGIKIDNKKINYFDFISSLENQDCNMALKRITPKIDMEKIHKIVEDTGYISDLQKAFYKTILTQRKEKILDFSLKKLDELEKG